MGWFEERTGWSAKAVRERLARRVPRASAVPVALGAALVVLVVAQALSGSLLAMYYKPAWDRAHASVSSIVSEIPLGWFVRSVHLWGAHLILALTLVHLVRTFWREEYRAPRDLAWIVKVLLLAVAAGLAITGQLLPLDAEAGGGALVASNIADAVGAGRLVRGGQETPGDYMLGRFFAAHVTWLPAAGVALLAAHLALSCRHATAPGDGPTALECAGLAALATVAVLAALAVLLPAGLGPAADLREMKHEERPLWFFLPAYQALNFGVPAIAVVAGGAAFFAGAVALPFVAKRWIRIAGAVVLVVALLLGVAGALSNRTIAGIRFDNHALPHSR
jgi:ubiquinol-cytochrome c reductase cytochrome b subunit